MTSAHRLAPAVLLLTLSAALPAVAQVDPNAIRTVPYANSYPTGFPPPDHSWSPDGKRFTFVAVDAKPGQVGQPGDIISVDTATGVSSVLVSGETISRLGAGEINEKDADHRSRYSMSSYLWADDSRHLLLDQGGKLWLFDIAAGTGTLVVATGAGSGDDPKFSPDAKSVSYLRNHNLYVHPVGPGGEIPLTTDTAPTTLNGEVDWAYLEELDVRSNYFWSPDSKHIAFLQADEAKVPDYPIIDFIPTHAEIDHQRYPQPGDPNPAVRIGIVPVTGGPARFIDLPFNPGNDYIPRFGWVDSETFYIETMRRDQKSRSLFFADLRTGQAREVYTDTDAKYLNTDYDITFLPHGRFIASSWRDNYTHLYLYNFDEHYPLSGPARLVRKLTAGDYDVFSVDGFDARTDTVFFTSNQGSPIETNLWKMGLDAATPTRVTRGDGVHELSVSPDKQHFSDLYSTLKTPPTASVCSLSAACSPFWKSNPIPPATGVTSSIVSFVAADGRTRLYATLTLPSDRTGTASVPLILNPYGGPIPTPDVRNGWTSPLFSELLAQHGFAVLDLDNRGGGGRGRDEQQVNYQHFGDVQLADQLAAIDQALARYPQLDAKRLGWWGWSWGGTFTLNAMTHSDRFKAGVAVAPVTDFRNYDSIYTERYLGLPGEDKAGYDAASVTLSAANLKGRVLIAFGSGDDNVHMANEIQFLEPLIAAGIPYDLQIFPRKTHSIAGPESRNELFSRILYHFETYLK